MGADVVDVGRPGTRALQGQRDGPGGVGGRRLGRADVERVGGQRAAGHGGVDPRPAGPGVLGRLQHGQHRALAVDEPVPVGVERPAGPGRVVVAPGQRAHRRQPGEHHRSDRGVGAAADHHVGLAGQNQPAPFQKGVDAAGAGQRARGDRPVHAEVDGHLAGGHVGDDRGHVVGAQPARLRPGDLPGRRLDLAHPGHGQVHHHAGAGLEVLIQDQARVGDRFPARGDGQLAEPGRPAQPLGVQQRGWIKVLDLSGDLGRQPGRVERRDRVHPGNALDQRLPGRLAVVADRGDGAQAGHHHLPVQVLCS